MFAPRAVRRLSSAGRQGMPGQLPWPGVHSCSGDSAHDGDKSHPHPWPLSLPRDSAAWGVRDGQNTGSQLGWDVGGSGGTGSGVTGDIFGVGERKRLKPALSACYKLAISRAEIWQSVNTGSKTARGKNVPGIHSR